MSSASDECLRWLGVSSDAPARWSPTPSRDAAFAPFAQLVQADRRDRRAQPPRPPRGAGLCFLRFPGREPSQNATVILRERHGRRQNRAVSLRPSRYCPSASATAALAAAPVAEQYWMRRRGAGAAGRGGSAACGGSLSSERSFVIERAEESVATHGDEDHGDEGPQPKSPAQTSAESPAWACWSAPTSGIISRRGVRGERLVRRWRRGRHRVTAML